MGEVVQIRSKEEALKLLSDWQRHAARLEALLLLIEAQRDASNTLLEIAEAELNRLRGNNGNDEQKA